MTSPSFMLESLPHFLLNIGTAVLLGVLLGLERQYRQHPAGLRTNSLVCLGAALFVSLSRLVTNPEDPTRIAAYVVSGVGLLGGGVILREGLNVRGMATAATLWCSAAVGALSGSGFPLHAAIGAAAVLGLHLFLRPLARRIDARVKGEVEIETSYRLRVVCPQDQEKVIRAILMRHVNAHPAMLVQGIATHDTDEPDQVAVVADIYSQQRTDRALEDLLTRINIEPSVTAASWERVR
jgi:putative Mg2+ transporter-C (MgtC) family protein